MPVYFSKLVDRYFEQWIKLSTWDSMHPLDMRRFYQFLRALRRYSRTERQTCEIRRMIVEAASTIHPDLPKRHILEMADFFSHRAQTVFDYEASFLDPLVEMRSPHDVFASLRFSRVIDPDGNVRDAYTLEEIEDFLVKHFGENWSERKR